MGGGWPGRLLGRDSGVIDKLTNYVSQSAFMAATVHCSRQDAIHKECLSASKRVRGRANAASTQAGYILLGQGVKWTPQTRATALIDDSRAKRRLHGIQRVVSGRSIELAVMRVKCKPGEVWGESEREVSIR